MKGGVGGGRRAIFIHVGALLHKTIRNNRGGITTAIRFGDGSRGSDRFKRGHPSRLDHAAFLPSPPALPLRSGRRAGKAWKHRLLSLFFLFRSSGPRRRYPTIVFLPPRARKASQGFRIEFRMPRRALPPPDLLTPGCLSS